MVPRDPNLYGENQPDTRLAWFCFDDQEAAKKIFGIENDKEIFGVNDEGIYPGPWEDAVKCISGNATVRVSNYVVDKLESEVTDIAKLEELVSKEDYSEECVEF